MREQLQGVRPGEQLALLPVRVAREEELAGRPRLVDGGDDAALRAGQAARLFHHLAHHGVDVEACGDPEDRLGQPGRPVARTRALRRLRRVGFAHGHGSLPPLVCRRSARFIYWNHMQLCIGI